MKNIFIIIVFIIFNLSSKASHFAGGEIWYEYVSPLVYKVHITCYMDCSPGNANYPFGSLCYNSVSGCGVPGTAAITMFDTIGVNDPFNGDTISPLCPSVQSYCQNISSIFPAFRYYHFAKIITLSNSCTDWRFGVLDNARNGNIVNGFASMSFAMYAELNNVVRPINSSPTLQQNQCLFFVLIMHKNIKTIHLIRI